MMPEQNTGPRDFVVGPADDGMRLDVFLAAACPDLSRSRVRADLEKDGAVLVDDRVRPASFRLKEGQRVAFTSAAREPLSAEPQAIDLTVVYEDEHIIVINKPVGLVVHPAVGHPDGTGRSRRAATRCGPASCTGSTATPAGFWWRPWTIFRTGGWLHSWPIAASAGSTWPSAGGAGLVTRGSSKARSPATRSGASGWPSCPGGAPH
jgi:hypothetical protein